MLVGKLAARGDDSLDAAPCRFHPAHTDAEKVLAGVLACKRKMRRLDAFGFQIRFKLGHGKTVARNG